MPRPNRIFRLNDTPNGLGLSCDETGLALAGVPLLCKTASGFAPRARDEIDALLSYVNEGREETVALSASGLASVAEALNRGDLVKAQMTALFMKVSDLDEDGAGRLAWADDALAKYSPDQLRDHGRFALEGATRTVLEQTTASFKPGALSAHYESHGAPGLISTGKGDHGGASYGTYQIVSGNIPNFVAHEGRAWPELQGKAPLTPGFNAAWKSVAAKDPKDFKAAQYAYIARTHYQPRVKQVREATGVDVSTHSHALQDVVWSTAVQHRGDATDIIAGAIRTVESKGVGPDDSRFDAAVINAIYDERGRTVPDSHVLVHFHSSRIDLQQNIAARFVSERRRALAELAAEQR